jgi:predicted nucleic acid-binding protein
VILVDTSVWIEHLRSGDSRLVELLEGRQVLAHPFVVGELALGNIKRRAMILDALGNLPRASVASDDEVLGLIEGRSLFGLGIGYVDVHLLASALLSDDASLWTRDRRLNDVAQRLGVAAGAS